MSANCSPEEAAQVADYIVWAEMSGNRTQGIIKLSGTEPLQSIVRSDAPNVTRDTKVSQLIDAGGSPAPIAAALGTDVVIRKASSHGIGLVGITDTFSSNGAQGYYVDRIARAGMIGLMVSRSPSATAAFGSIDPLFGTNPIGFAFPTSDDPITFDAATSAMTFYGLVLAKAQGRTIPEGKAIDKDGKPTTDPGEAMEGALLSFDNGYKGQGLAMLVELLAGPFRGGAFIDNQTFKEGWGTLIIAIDPELFVDRAEFVAGTTEFRRRIRNARTADGESIRMPGEGTSARRKQAEDDGFVEIDDELYEKIFTTSN